MTAGDVGDMQGARSLGDRVRRVAVHPATFALLPLAVITVVVVVRAGYFVPRFDYAIQELAVQEAARAHRLLGPYSRFGFNHPGPMLFYANVPAYLLLGKNAGLSMILHAPCRRRGVRGDDRRARRSHRASHGRVGAAVGLVWFELRAGLEWFRDPWNPYVVVLPIVVAIVAAPRWSTRRRDGGGARSCSSSRAPSRCSPTSLPLRSSVWRSSSA